MGKDSNIEWCRNTRNLWHGCSKVHCGCDHCYAETTSVRWGREIWGDDKPRMEIKNVWDGFRQDQKIAAACKEMHRDFVGSMMDIFEKPMPLISSKMKPITDYDTGFLRAKYFNEVVPATPNIMHLMLTKRPGLINRFIPIEWKDRAPRNVMYGTSPADQPTANSLVPVLLKTKGVHFLSVEPMVGPISLVHLGVHSPELCGCGSHADFCPYNPHAVEGKENDPGSHKIWKPVDWVIVGGESGTQKRKVEIDWFRRLRDECLAAGVPFFMKQVDKVQEIPEDLLIRQFNDISYAAA